MADQSPPREDGNHAGLLITIGFVIVTLVSMTFKSSWPTPEFMAEVAAGGHDAPPQGPIQFGYLTTIAPGGARTTYAASGVIRNVGNGAIEFTTTAGEERRWGGVYEYGPTKPAQ